MRWRKMKGLAPIRLATGAIRSAELHWYEATASGGKVRRSNASLTNGMKGEQLRSKFVLCIRNGGSDDLEVRKLYQVFPDPTAAHDGYARVIDESGEDYLYPSEYFVPVRLPAAASKALLMSA
jgi:hypothetical protein